MTTEAERARLPANPMREIVVLVGTLGCIYIISQFLRNSIGVIAPDLAVELSLSASEIGLLSSVFFFTFAAVQIPLGVALDRYGPRRCMLVCAVIAVIGTLMFASATTPALLIVARMLMGIGSSCYLMAPLALYAKRFPPDRFATLVGIQIGLGTLGTLLATAPYAWAVALAGWRVSFFVIAGAMLLAGFLIAVVVREDRTRQTGMPRETLRESLAGTMQAVRTPSFWRIFLVQLTSYSSFVIVVGLWGGPYLTHIYGYGLTERGNMLFLAVAAQIIGSFAWGPMDRVFKSYKIPVLIGNVMTAMTMAFAAIVGIMSPGALVIWFIAIGAATASITILIAHGKSLFPPHLAGRGMTLFNMATMGGVFLSQTITGFLIDLFPTVGGGYALDAYRVVFGFQACAMLLGCLVYLGSRDPRRNPR